MDNTVNKTANAVIVKPGIQLNVTSPAKNDKKLLADLTEAIDGKIFVVALIFLIIMFMPAHIGAVMACIVGVAMCLQLKQELSGAYTKIENLEKSLCALMQNKEQLENNAVKLIESKKTN